MTHRPAGRGPSESREGAVTGRHPGDGLRLAFGCLLLAVSVLAVHRDRLTTLERNAFRLVNDLPTELAAVLAPVMELGNVVAAPVVGVLVYLATRRHLRITIDVTVAGIVAWWAAKAVKALIERPRPVGFVVDASRLVDSGLGFVSGHTAVAAAIATAAGPYLPRRWRRVAWGLPWLVGLARIFYGAHLPLDIVGGAALGWAIGAGLHLLAGAPHRAPTLEDAEAVLRRTGRGHWTVHHAPVDAKGSFPFVADDGVRRLFVKVFDDEPRDRDWLYRAARFLAFRDVRDEVAIDDSRAQGEHEAALSMLARSAGVRTPQVRSIEVDGPHVWILSDHVAGRPLDQLTPGELCDAALDDLWRQLRRLRRAGIAHRDLVPSNILLDDEQRPWLVDFAHARTTHERHAFDNDVAELLISTAAGVGPERAVAAARSVLDRDEVASALAELQPLALSAEARARLRRDEGFLAAVRGEVARCAGLPRDDAPAVTGGRRSAALVASTVGAVIALVAIAGPGPILGAFEGDAWRWLGAATLATLGMALASAVTLLAAIDRRLAVGRTALLCLDEARRGLLGGPERGRHLVIRQLERAGVPIGEAVAGVSRRRRVQRVVVLLSLVIAVPAFATTDPELRVDWSHVAMAAIAVAAAAIAIAASCPAAPGWPSERDASQAESSPTSMWAAAAVQVAAGIACTAAVVEAVSGSPAVAGIAVVQLVAASVPLIVAVPVGAGASTGVLAAGLGILGLRPEAAIAAAIATSAVQVWAPSLIAGMVPRRGVGESHGTSRTGSRS